MNHLQALVVSRLIELDLSARAAAERSRGKVSYSTLRNISRGIHGGKITDRIAEGISSALDVPLSQVYEAAQAPQPMSTWEWPERFERLKLPQRRLVEDVAAALLDAYDQGVRDAS